MIYTCKVSFSDVKQIEVEAKTPAEAEEKALDQIQEEYSPDCLGEVEVWESACQYSDQEELKDQEQRGQ